MNKEQTYLHQKYKRGSKGVYLDKEKGIYVRIYRGRRWRGLKKQSHKKLRASKTEKPTNKEFDIDWIYF